MRWVLDTNVWIEAATGAGHATRVLAQAAAIEWCGFSAISRLEIFGFPNLTPADEQHFQIILGQFREVAVSSLVVDEAIRIRKQTRIKTPDALIAATALVENAQLVTRNVADFQSIPSLVVVNSASS